MSWFCTPGLWRGFFTRWALCGALAHFGVGFWAVVGIVAAVTTADWAISTAYGDVAA